MSQRYGKNAEFVLDGGGNTSLKEDGVLYVKGSGVKLSDIQAEQFVAMDLIKLLAIITRDYPVSMNEAQKDEAALADIMSARLAGEDDKRPSVEAVLHAMLPYKYVLHVHPPLINGLTCSAEGSDACKRLFGDKAVWIDISKPGLMLAGKCDKAFKAYSQKHGNCPQITLLQNHGIFIAAETVDEIDKLMYYAVSTVKGKIKEMPLFEAVPYDNNAVHSLKSAFHSVSFATAAPHTAVFCTNKQILKFVTNEKSFLPIRKSFTPDNVVMYGDEALFISLESDTKTNPVISIITDEFAKFNAKHGHNPIIVALQNLGFFALGESEDTAKRVESSFLDAIKIATYATSFGGIGTESMNTQLSY